MKHSDFMDMKYAFKNQFNKYMIEDGHDALSIQFFRGWTMASSMEISR
jgi:hypothetical protein